MGKCFSVLEAERLSDDMTTKAFLQWNAILTRYLL